MGPGGSKKHVWVGSGKVLGVWEGPKGGVWEGSRGVRGGLEPWLGSREDPGQTFNDFRVPLWSHFGSFWEEFFLFFFYFFNIALQMA